MCFLLSFLRMSLLSLLYLILLPFLKNMYMHLGLGMEEVQVRIWVEPAFIGDVRCVGVSLAFNVAGVVMALT